MTSHIPDYVYRVLRPDEIDTYPKSGLVANKPGANISIEQHVDCDIFSQYISTCKTWPAAITFASKSVTTPKHIVQIDIQKLKHESFVKFIDISTPGKAGVHLNGKAIQSASAIQLILIQGTVPASCVSVFCMHVYRVLRPDENTIFGLVAKNPAADVSVEQHVEFGSRTRVPSQYISTSKTLNASMRFATKGFNEPKIIVKIDIGKLYRVPKMEKVEIFDLSTRDKACAYIPIINRNAINLAAAFEEILITGLVPASCVSYCMMYVPFLPYKYF